MRVSAARAKRLTKFEHEMKREAVSDGDVPSHHHFLLSGDGGSGQLRLSVR